MMKKILLILSSLFIALQIQSQITVKYSVGYGSYDMSGMKDYMEETKSAILQLMPGLDIVTTDKFPSYVTHTVNVGYKIQKHEMGLAGTYLNTAGKYSYADYSGSISSKMQLNGYRVGLYYKYNFYEIKLGTQQQILFFGEISPSLLISKVKVKNTITPPNSILEGEDKNFNSINFSILPQIGVQYNITSHIGLFFSGGYDIDMGSKVKELNNSKIDWSGFRLHGGASYYF